MGCTFWVLILYTLILTAGAITFIVLSFLWFLGPAVAPTGIEVDCGGNMALIIVTIVMFVAVFALFCRPDSSLFTSAMVNLWLCYLLWSALASQPDPVCNTVYGAPGTTVFQIVSHLIWTFVTLLSLAIATTDDAEAKGANPVGALVAEEGDDKKGADDIEVQTAPAGDV